MFLDDGLGLGRLLEGLHEAIHVVLREIVNDFAGVFVKDRLMNVEHRTPPMSERWDISFGAIFYAPSPAMAISSETISAERWCDAAQLRWLGPSWYSVPT